MFLNSLHSTHTIRSWNSFRELSDKWKAPIQRLRKARGSNKCNGHWNLLLPCNCWSTRMQFFRAQELSESQVGHLGFPVPNTPYGLCAHMATFGEEEDFFVLGFASPWITLHFVKLLCKSVRHTEKRREKKKFKKHTSEATEHPDLGSSF